ncbi:MAG: amidohydrolase family protein [Armatimonadetes bacterium]|nr:amidohydrolase family protein [Armatimonadota bacterium]
MHLNKNMPAAQLIALMDSAGVTQSVLMARYYRGDRSGGEGSDEQALSYAKQYPGRFLPFVAGQRPELLEQKRWLEPDEVAKKLLEQVEERLRSGEFSGLGELIIRHHSYMIPQAAQMGSEVDIPVDTPLMRAFADLAARYQVPMTIHAEAEPRVVPGMVSLLEYNPKARIIWAHSCGRSSAKAIREMLTRHPNLFCDLGDMTRIPASGYGNYWPRQTPSIFLIEDGTGRLYDDMKALYEEFSDRFVLGTDNAHTPSLRSYEARIRRWRQLLSGLSAGTARRLAHLNAEQLFTRKGSK